MFSAIVYRATIAKYATALDGAGAAQGSRNRWNERDQFVTYAAASRALAVLEQRVHAPVGPPKNAVIAVIQVELQDHQVRMIRAVDLPEGWRDPYEVRHCQIRGARWYAERSEEHMLIVPSAVLPAENIFVIRGGVQEARVVDVETLDFDPRLWLPASGARSEIMTIVPE